MNVAIEADFAVLGGCTWSVKTAQKFGYRCATVRSVAEVLSDFDHADAVFASWMSRSVAKRGVVLQFGHRCAKTIFDNELLFIQLVDGEWQL